MWRYIKNHIHYRKYLKHKTIIPIILRVRRMYERHDVI